MIKAFFHRHSFASSDETRSQSQRLTLVVFLLPTEAAPVLLLNLFPRLHQCSCQLWTRLQHYYTSVWAKLHQNYCEKETAVLERKCVNFCWKGKVRLLSPYYGVHALAVAVDAGTAALAADGEVGVLGTKVCKCRELEPLCDHTKTRSLPHQRYRRPLSAF